MDTEKRRMQFVGRFDLGAIRKTPRVSSCIANREIVPSLCRHVNGDWGVVDLAIKDSNEKSLATQGKLVSAYLTRDGCKYLISTNLERTLTVISLADESNNPSPARGCYFATSFGCRAKIFIAQFLPPGGGYWQGERGSGFRPSLHAQTRKNPASWRGSFMTATGQ